MRAFQVHSHDAPPRLEEVTPPDPGAGQLRLSIEACGVNFADTLMVTGRYQDTPALPFTLGMEVCGTVEALGPGVEGPSVGTRVVVFSGQGGMAEKGVFAASDCRPVPDGMPAEVAAGFQVAYGTSHLALDHRARLKPGETLLVLGAAGGVGLTAVEVGKLMGARVIAVARGAEKCAIARAAGADHVFDSTEDIRAEVKALGGADVVYDPVGGDLFTAALRATRPQGRILTIGFASGDVPQIAANHVMVKNIDVIGVYWGAYLRFAPQVLLDSLATLMTWYEDGRLRPHISHVVPLSDAEEALDLLRSRRSSGKVVVSMTQA